jgi:ribosomal protein L14E/L6E/L27E
MELNEITLTKHLIDRWKERFPEEVEMKDDCMIEEDIREWIRDAYPILSQIQDEDDGFQQEYIFLYNNYRTMVVCIDTCTGITIYPCDYNHSEEIDKMVANQLYKSIVDIDEKLKYERETTGNEVDRIDADIHDIEEQLKSLQRQSDKLKAQKTKLESMKDEAVITINNMEEERESLAKQLAYSSSYRAENRVRDVKKLESMINSALGNPKHKRRR